MEDLDVRLVIKKLIRKWYWFAFSLVISLGLAFLYLAKTEKEYLVESTLQLKDQSVSGQGADKQEFINGFGLLNTDPELEDEIGVLTSYSSIQQCLNDLGFEISYYEYPTLLKQAGTFFAKQVYPASFSVNMDSAGWQLMHTPIHISFPEDGKYRLKTEADETPLFLYNFSTHSVKEYSEKVKLDTILSVGQQLKTPFLDFTLEFINPEVWNGKKDFYFTIQSLGNVTEQYRSRLSNSPLSENSNIIKLSLKGPVPEKDKVFLNVLSSVYIDNNLRKKNRLGERTIEFIDFQLQGVSDSLNRTENRLESFRAQNHIIDIGVTSQNLTQQLFSLEERQAQLSVQNKYYQYMADYLAKNDDVTDIVAPSSVGIQDNLLSSLLIQLSKLNEEKISKDYNSSKFNPAMQVLERKIKSTKKGLIDNIHNLIGSNDIALRENNRRVQEIQRSIERLPQNEKNLTDIKRRFTFNDNIYNYLLQKKAEAGIAIASNVPDKNVIDAPRQIGSGPVGPNRMFILLIAIMVGVITPAGLIFTKDFFQQRLESEDQIKLWTSIPIVAQISQLKGREKTNGYTGESYLAHAFRYLRQHVGILQMSHKVKVVGITSSKSGEGKTFCALHLALSFAHAGRKTLLIDADLHQPALGLQFRLKHQTGLSDYLLKGNDQIIHKTETNNLDIITAGTLSENPSDLLNQTRLDNLITLVKEQYDIIIIDTPPVGMIADYLQLSRYIDYSLLVIRHEFTEKNEIQRTDKLIKDFNLQAGLIYNGTQIADSYKGYYKKAVKKVRA